MHLVVLVEVLQETLVNRVQVDDEEVTVLVVVGYTLADT